MDFFSIVLVLGVGNLMGIVITSMMMVRWMSDGEMVLKRKSGEWIGNQDLIDKLKEN